MRRALAAAAVLAVATTSACREELGLAIERDQPIGFDPIRFDPGKEPEGEIPVEKLRFSITPFYTPQRQRQMLERMRVWLEARVGIPVEARVSESYQSAVDDLARGELEVAQLSPFACVKAAAEIPDVELLATAIAQGTGTYASYLVTKDDAAIHTIDDAKHKTLALTEPWSTSGFLYPWAWLRRRGLDPRKDFQVVLLGQHDQALDALLDGRVDVAAVSSDTLVSRGVLGISGPVRIIAKAGRIPYDCVAARRALGPRLRWRVQKAFLELSILTPEGRAVLRDYNLINGFMPVPRGHYDAVKAIDDAYGKEVSDAAASLSTLEATSP